MSADDYPEGGTSSEPKSERGEQNRGKQGQSVACRENDAPEKELSRRAVPIEAQDRTWMEKQSLRAEDLPHGREGS